MVTVVHVYNRWSKSEVKCFVDGQMVSHSEMSWLVSTNDVSTHLSYTSLLFEEPCKTLFLSQPFGKCYLGSSQDQDTDTMFCGQLSSVYLFSEALTPQQIAAVYQLGSGYKVGPPHFLLRIYTFSLVLGSFL